MLQEAVLVQGVPQQSMAKATFGSSSSKLTDAVVEMLRCFANGIVKWVKIKTLMPCRVMALDKCPGV